MTNNNINLFLESKPDKPKIIYFTEQKEAPFLLKAISHTFFDTMHVGIARNTEEQLAKKYKITNFPSVIIIRRKAEKPLYYKGEMNLPSLLDFINPYSEKFIFGDPKTKLVEDEKKILKPWLTEDLPELTQASADDVCYKTGRLCVIYLTQAEPNAEIKNLFQSLKNKYAKDAKFAFMWLNAGLEKAFFNVLKLDLSELPKLVFLNVGNMKRMLVHSGDITESAIDKTIDAIYSADARFVRMAIKEFPQLTSRDAKKDL